MESLGCFLSPKSSTFPGRLLWGRMDSVVWEGLAGKARPTVKIDRIADC